jgi:hypothetical protein
LLVAVAALDIKRQVELVVVLLELMVVVQTLAPVAHKAQVVLAEILKAGLLMALHYKAELLGPLATQAVVVVQVVAIGVVALDSTVIAPLEILVVAVALVTLSLVQ